MIRFFASLAGIVLIFFSCKNTPSKHDDAASVIRTDSFYGAVIADTIIYDVIIRNNDPEDLWAIECLQYLKYDSFIDSIFKMVDDKEITAYDFFTKQPLSLTDIQNIETEEGFSKNNIGKIQFAERWYLDKKSQHFQKEVISIVLGYELFNLDSTSRGYKPIYKLYLNH